MHELSIAESILEIVRAHAPPGRTVTSIRVRVGALSGVVPDSLEFCFTAITQDTPLAAARLALEFIPFVIQCRTCGVRSDTEPGLALCPGCGGTDTRIVSGTELQVAEIEIDDSA